MPEKSRFGWASFAELCLALCAGWALASASPDPGARLVPLLFAAAFFVPLRRLPAGPARRLERASWLVVGLTAVYGFAWSIYPVVPEAVVRVFPRLASLALVLLLAALLAARSSFASHRASLPCAPEPPPPTQSQHGVPLSTLADIP